jgi:ribonucrease Y
VNTIFLLAQDSGNSGWLPYGLGGLVLGAVLFFIIGKLLGIQAIAQSKRQAQDLLDKAQSEAQTLKKQAELDGLNELAKRREAFEAEVNDQRNQIKETERRVTKREDNLDRKLDTLTTKEKYLDDLDAGVKKRETQLTGKLEEADTLTAERRELIEAARREQKQTLLRIANLSEDDAKRESLKAVERECQHEAGQLIQKITEQAEEEAKDTALKITLQAIQRYASEHTADSTVSAVTIPSDDMKGRVIGREGRNIRAFEKATGVDVIVDDTPGVIVVSCFDPVRRAIAAETMHKLIEDGRIHPTRIEEVTEQTTKDINQRIVKYGKDACIEANIQGLHPKLSETMGRLYYRTSYGQNILRHSMEAAYLCQVMAEELGLDGELARRCGFLHDIGKALDHEAEGGHPQIGMDFAKKFGEKEAVLNAIGGHHNDIPATTPYTPIVMAADAISGARPGARRETLDRYVKRLEQLEGIATDMKGVKNAYAIQAGREVRVIVDPDNVDDTNCSYIARDIAKRISEEMTFPGEIRVTVLREMRTIEYAK